MRAAVTVFVLLLAVLVGQLAAAWPGLPERMATHFDGAGEANGWMSKDGFLVFYAAMIALMVLTFAGLAAVIPRFPDTMINLPHKEYWLAPERRAASFEALQSWMLWMGNATLFFFSILLHLLVQANRGPGAARLDDAFLWALVFYLGFTAVWTVDLLRRFRRPPT